MPRYNSENITALPNESRDIYYLPLKVKSFLSHLCRSTYPSVSHPIPSSEYCTNSRRNKQTRGAPSLNNNNTHRKTIIIVMSTQLEAPRDAKYINYLLIVLRLVPFVRWLAPFPVPSWAWYAVADSSWWLSNPRPLSLELSQTGGFGRWSNRLPGFFIILPGPICCGGGRGNKQECSLNGRFNQPNQGPLTLVTVCSFPGIFFPGNRFDAVRIAFLCILGIVFAIAPFPDELTIFEPANRGEKTRNGSRRVASN